MNDRSSPGLFEAVFWDHDGVLVDTEPLYYQATAEILAAHGVELTPDAFRDLFLVESRGAWHLLDERGIPHAAVGELRERRDARYAGRIAGRDLAIPGAREVLSRLAGRFRMGIVTSSRRVHFEAIHRSSGLEGFFDFVVTREDSARSKPDPEPYLKALARAGVPPVRCVAIEDSERGLRSAKGAGLACWVVPHDLTAKGDFRAADRVLPDLGAVGDLLLSAAHP